MSEQAPHSEQGRVELPRWAERLLLRLAPFRNRDTVVGDFAEIYQYIAAREGRRWALRWYWGQVLKSLPAFFSNSLYYGGDMLRNYLKISLRHLRRQKGYSFINISGLALGLACCVLILLFVQNELSYDRFHNKAERIYRVVMDAQSPNGSTDRFVTMSQRAGRAIREEFPEVQYVVRMSTWNPSIKHQGEYFYDDDFLFAEPAFFEIFSFPMLKGDPQTALNAPNALVMTASMEEKYFAAASALGQTLTLNDTLTVTVTGVIADFPANAHFKTDFLVSHETLLTFRPENEGWLSNLDTYVYLLLHEGVSAEAFEPKMADLITRNNRENLESTGLTVTLGLQPLTDIHLHSNRRGEFGPNGDIIYVYIFSVIALFILFIACFNFINLSTARSMERAREVGMRKVMGSSRGLLIRQFLSESVVLCGFAFVLALGIIGAALPYFSDLAGKEIPFSRVLNPTFALSMLGLTLLVGLLAGSYPAFVFSGFSAIEVLKGVFHSSAKGGMLRKGLVVFQFALSIALIASTTVVFDQVAYMRGQDLGFDKEQVLVVDARNLPTDVMQRQHETLKAEFMRHPSIQYASASMSVPGQSTWLQVIFAEGLDENDSRRVQLIPIDDNYVETLGIEMAAGRDFSPEFVTDQEEGVLVNEAAVERIGWGTPEDAVGKRINFGGDQDLRVVGVIKDYHHDSLKETLEPMLFLVYPQAFRYFSVRLDRHNMPETIAHLEQTWKTLFPSYAFESFFLDADLDNQYRAEQQLTKIFGTFALIAIVIACLGLFGLAAFTAQQRTKEIGVRKVLGASITGIVALLSKDFLRLVLIGFVVASPLAYFGMRRWLESFAYRTEISWWIFLVAGLLALAIALLTVSYQAIRAALANPVEALHHE